MIQRRSNQQSRTTLMERAFVLACACLVLLVLPVASRRHLRSLDVPATASEEARRRPMMIEDLFRFERVADPQVSPDGKHVAYTVSTVDQDANKITTAIW